MQYPLLRNSFLPLQGVNRTGVAHLTTFVGVLLWLALQLALFWVQGTGGGTAYGAHLGGLAMGVILALALRMPRQAGLDRLLHDAARRRASGNFHASVGLLQRYLELQPSDEAAQLDLARALQMSGDPGRSLNIFRRIVDARLAARDIEAACDLYLEAHRANHVFHLEAEAQKQIAFWLEKRGYAVEASSAHLDLVRFHPDAEGVDHAMARAATLLATRPGEKHRAIDLLRRTIRDFPESALRPLLEDELLRLRQPT